MVQSILAYVKENQHIDSPIGYLIHELENDVVEGTVVIVSLKEMYRYPCDKIINDLRNRYPDHHIITKIAGVVTPFSCIYPPYDKDDFMLMDPIMISWDYDGIGEKFKRIESLLNKNLYVEIVHDPNISQSPFYLPIDKALIDKYNESMKNNIMDNYNKLTSCIASCCLQPHEIEDENGNPAEQFIRFRAKLFTAMGSPSSIVGFPNDNNFDILLVYVKEPPDDLNLDKIATDVITYLNKKYSNQTLLIKMNGIVMRLQSGSGVATMDQTTDTRHVFMGINILARTLPYLLKGVVPLK